MARRRLIIKRIDPWSVLKFGAVANVVLLMIFLIIAGVVWYIIDRLQLVDQACGIATDVGFTTCGVDAENLFRALALLGGLWTIVQTAVLVFFAFLYNLIADLTGGLAIGVIEEGGPARREDRSASATTTGPNTWQRSSATTGGQPIASSGPVERGQAERGQAERRGMTRRAAGPDATGELDTGADELFGERR